MQTNQSLVFDPTSEHSHLFLNEYSLDLLLVFEYWYRHSVQNSWIRHFDHYWSMPFLIDSQYHCKLANNLCDSQPLT